VEAGTGTLELVLLPDSFASTGPAPVERQLTATRPDLSYLSLPTDPASVEAVIEGYARGNQHPVMASTDALFGGEPDDAVLVPLL